MERMGGKEGRKRVAQVTGRGIIKDLPGTRTEFGSSALMRSGEKSRRARLSIVDVVERKRRDDRRVSKRVEVPMLKF